MATTTSTPQAAATTGIRPLSAGHGASLCTTAGITAVITGVMAVGLAAQAPATLAVTGRTPDPVASVLAGMSITALALGAAALYEARNAIGEVLDGPAQQQPRLTAYALAWYHLGMGAVFAGLAFAAAWRLAGPLGGVAWAAPAVAGLAAAAAAGRAGRAGSAWSALSKDGRAP